MKIKRKNQILTEDKVYHFKLRERHKKQFTLVEILTVVAILAFLMAIAVAGYSIAVSKAAETATQSLIAEIEVAMESYKAKTGYEIQQKDAGPLIIDTPKPDMENPTWDVDFTDFLTNYTKLTKNGTIDTDNHLIDAYGEEFHYKCPGAHNRGGFDIESAGADGKFGDPNGDEDKQEQLKDNINNWDY